MSKAWTSEEIQTIVRAYQGACVLMAGAELDVFTRLSQGPATAQAVAESLGVDRRGITVLLDALTAMELLEKSAGAYRLAAGVGDVLTAGGQATHLAMTRHQANCLRRWSRLADTIKAGSPTKLPSSVLGEAGDQASFIEAMNDISAPVAETVVRDISSNVEFAHVMDVGGGSGTWTLAWLAVNPQASATLFDLPHVIPMAEKRLKAAGVMQRVNRVAGDFTRDELPAGADLVWLSAIIHQQSREENRQLYARCARALRAGGRIMIRDMVMNETHTQPAIGAMFAVNMLSATRSGGTFSLEEIREDLTASGFAEVQQIRADQGMNAVVAARKK